MTHGLQLGLFAHFAEEDDAGDGAYDEFLDLFVHAERLGFGYAWVRQFHLQGADGRRAGGLPSPFVFLAALASRTRSLRLGTAAVTLPLESVVRVAEDAAVLDVLSGGRVELGVANGGGMPGLAEAFGRTIAGDADEQRTLYRHDLAILEAALRGAGLNANGDTLFPPRTSLGDRLWEATLTDRSARLAARAGHGVLIGTTQTIPAEVTAAAYHEALPDGRSPRVGLSALIYPAKDRATGLREAEAGILRKWEWGREFLPPATTLEEKAASLNIHYGASDDLIESISTQPAFAFATHLQVQVELLYSSFAARHDALEAFVTEVAPALGWAGADHREEALV
ncbi:putative FMN-dependent luciferase-like monooxygenase [Agromyces badenianii]|uniref:Putative FMN-dependent luciferase-like monooxygenase n=1 Tax=Agromyces badenianii TaxID=2080742 RepID=A0A2S0WTL5_9MICO|nr:LLM class flavin-dependent oxidoreductase [Agromyces badenianii]AWB94679.1 putative FMN-dependent luciferase-like monooxygenase [Agromyces badenianii]